MLKIQFNTANACFANDEIGESVQVLRKLADRLEFCGLSYLPESVLDINGNKIGTLKFVKEQDQND